MCAGPLNLLLFMCEVGFLHVEPSPLVPVPRGPAPWFPGDWHVYMPGASALCLHGGPNFFSQLLP